MSSPPTDPLVGTTIGQYEVVARLGGGGMGIVYAARDTRLGRRVALKFLPAQWSHDEAAKDRFVREAQAASATDHPNICTIHDIGADGDGRLFIVMAQYDGETLKHRLAAGRLPVDEAIDIAAQIAEGLAKAHAAGVVHRDIKPGNIMLTEDGVRILDFGLAKFADARLQLTMEGSTLGTIAYMSPEQTRGDDADARSDIWATGVVLYEMLTGTVPFRGGYPEAISHAIRNDPAASMRAAGIDIPEALEQLVFRALHKTPAVRFQSARDLARMLRQMQGRTLPLDLRTEPLSVPTGAPVLPPRPARSRRLRLAWVAAATALLIGTPAWILAPIDRTPIAVAAFANTTPFPELDPYRLALTAELIHQLESSPTIRPVGYDRLLEVLQPFRTGTSDVAGREALQAIASQTGAPMILVPSLVYDDGSLRARVERRDPQTGVSELMFETAPVASSLITAAAYSLVPALSQGVLRETTRQGPLRAAVAQTLLAGMGRGPAAPANRLARAEAAAAFEQGLAAYEQLEYAAAHDAFAKTATLDPRNPLPLAWQARVSTLMRRDGDAATAAGDAARLPTEALSERDRRFVQAVVAEVAGRADEARRAYEQLALAFPDDSTGTMELAGFEDRQGRTAASVAAYQRVPALGDRVRSHLELCKLHARTNEVALARDHGEAALAAYQALGNRGGEAQARWCLTDVLRAGADNDRRAARQHAEAALQIMEALGYPYGLARAYNYLGVVALTAERNGRAAAEYFEKTLAAARGTGNVFLESRALMNLGVSYEMFGSYAEAVEHYEESFTLFSTLGSQQEAAWQQINAAAIRIEAGLDPRRGLVDAQNALAVFTRLGDRRFEVHARRIIARQLRFAGPLQEAADQLAQARNVARQYDLPAARVVIDLAGLRTEQGDLAEALSLLGEIGDTAEGLEQIQALIERGRAHTRLGAFDAARQSFGAAAAAIAMDDPASLALLRFAQGELAYESGRAADARAEFTRAIELAPDGRNALATSEERAYVGLIDARQGRTASGRRQVAASLAAAASMGRAALEARCRLFLARIDIANRRFDEAARTLSEMPPESALGLELRAQVHHWRAIALASLGQPDQAAAERATARQLIDNLRARAPQSQAAGLLARPDIAAIVN
jgi:tetratricopeptide (TPR) repeat protein